MSSRHIVSVAHTDGRCRGASQAATRPTFPEPPRLQAPTIVEANLASTIADHPVMASPTTLGPNPAGDEQSAPLIPLARLLARHAAHQHLHRRHRGHGLIQAAIVLGAVALILIGALLLAQRLRGER